VWAGWHRAPRTSKLGTLISNKSVSHRLFPHPSSSMVDQVYAAALAAAIVPAGLGGPPAHQQLVADAAARYGSSAPTTPFTALAAALGRTAIQQVASGGGFVTASSSLPGSARGIDDTAGRDAGGGAAAPNTPITAALKAMSAAKSKASAAAAVDGVDGPDAGRDTAAAAYASKRDTPSKGMAGYFARGDEERLVAAIAIVEGRGQGAGGL